MEINNKNQIVEKTLNHVKTVMDGENSGHDFWHVFRVWNNAKNILKSYPQANSLIVECAALLHDIADWKFNNGNSEIGAKTAQDFLLNLGLEKDDCNKVFDIIANMSFKGANVKNTITTLEGQIVQDADRLDAIGAIGIARAFAYGGANNRELHTPENKPELHNSAQSYLKSKGGTINHFYEKLLLLKDRMNTEEARKIAQKRHLFMEEFLNNFYNEWNGVQ